MSAKAITRSPLSIIAIIICVITYVRLVNIPSYNIGRGGKSARVREVLLDPFDQRVLVCAHRCGNPPENSLSALSRAIAMNADIVEIDAAMTADGVVVLMHDRNVDRTTYGRGPVSELTLREFSELRLRKSMTGECPPTLEKFLRVAGEDLMVCIDMKKAVPEKVVEAVRKTDSFARTIFYCKESVIAQVRRLAPEAIVMVKLRGESQLERVALGIQPELIQVSPEKFSARLSLRIRMMGARPWVNSIGTRDYVAFLNLYAGYMPLLADMPGVAQTDEPQMVMEFLRRQRLNLE